MPGFTGFGGSWKDGVHSGGDSSGSIGGGSGVLSVIYGGYTYSSDGALSALNGTAAAAAISRGDERGAITAGAVINIGGMHAVSSNGDATSGSSGSGTIGVFQPGQIGGINWSAAKINTNVMSEIALRLGINMHAANILAGVITAKNDTVRNGVWNIGGPDTDSARAALERLTPKPEEITDAIKFTTDFYKELTEKYSQNASALAQDFAAKVHGKTIRSVDQALAEFNKYKGSLGNKFSVQDRNAIAAALNSKTFNEMASSLTKYSRAFGYVGTFIDFTGAIVELKNAIVTDNWRPFFVKIESLISGKVATGVAAFAFTAMTGLPVGIIGFALIMAAVGALVDDSLVDSINVKLGI